MSFLAFMIPWKDEPLFMPFPLQLSFRDRTASSIPFFQANNQGDHWSLLIFLVWKTCFWNHGFPPFEFLGAVCWEVAGPKRWCLFLHLAEKYPRRCSGHTNRLNEWLILVVWGSMVWIPIGSPKMKGDCYLGVSQTTNDPPWNSPGSRLKMGARPLGSSQIPALETHHFQGRTVGLFQGG